MDIQKTLQEEAENNGAVGAALCFIDQGEPQFFFYGKKSIKSEEPLLEETVFEIGSITQVFTTLALADKVAKGEMLLKDPIEKYLPKVKVPEFKGKKISVGHLATHSSGLPKFPTNFNPQNINNPYSDYTLDLLYHFLSLHVLTRAPGTALEYSHIGMGLLGHILSLQSDISYEALLTTLIEKPLGMSHTSISRSKVAPNLASGHHKAIVVDPWDNPVLTGATSLLSNIKDMSQFLLANLEKIDSPLNTLLQTCHKKRYRTGHLITGLGWILLNSPTSELIIQNGSTGGFRSFIGFDHKAQKGVVILSNSREEWTDELGKHLLDPHFPLSSINKELSLDTDYLNKFTGQYELVFPQTPSKQKLQISLSDRHLAILFTGGLSGLLYPKKFSLFGVKGFPEGKVQFSFDSQGYVSRAQAFASNETLLWEAIPRIDLSS